MNQEYLRKYPVVGIRNYAFDNSSFFSKRTLYPVISQGPDYYFWINGNEAEFVEELGRLGFTIYTDCYGRESIIGEKILNPFGKSYLNSSTQVYEYYPPEDQNEKFTKMEIGRCLLVDDTRAILSPCYIHCSPNNKFVSRYDRIVSKLALVKDNNDFLAKFHTELNYEDDWLVQKGIYQGFREDKRIENYFPLNLKNEYFSKFSCEWLFIKNVTADKLMVYPRVKLSESDYIVINPGGVITLCNGMRFSHDKYEIQYKDRNHPDVGDTSLDLIKFK